MNLINEPWIPVHLRDGTTKLITPWQLTVTENPVVALDAVRPDFNAALLQFLIGLLQTAASPTTEEEWVDWLETPPTPDDLKDRFTPYSYAFDLQDAKGSFMQDFNTLDNSGFTGIAQLLIEAPGDNAIKNNKDLFIKRGQIDTICPSCTTIALLTLQINAPAGGQGHRTSLRGGGPLSTLVVPDEQAELPDDLWRRVWLNVLSSSDMIALSGDENRLAPPDLFPWLAATRTSEKTGGQETTPLDTHPLQMYWAMPRRIRVKWDTGLSGQCDICNASTKNLISQYSTQNYGINYTGAWRHPLSPYSVTANGDWLAQHAQPDGLTYQHWLRLAMHDSNQEPTYFNAITVARYLRISKDWEESLRLHVFGYDMDNMKARCWYEATFPLLTVPEAIRFEFSKRVQTLTETAGEFAGFVRSTVKDAWFKRPKEAKGDLSFLTKSFYQNTETDFFSAVRELQIKLANGTDREVLNDWHQTLLKAAVTIFDYWAASGDIAQANPRRVALARNKLFQLAYSNKIKQALQLPPKSKP